MLHESHLETHVNCGDFDLELMEADVQGAQGDRLEHKPEIRCVSHQQKQLRVRHLTIIVKMNMTSLPYFGVKLSCVCLMFADRKK